MGADVYTPGYQRMLETDECLQWRIRYDEWMSRESVVAQHETDEDWADFTVIMKVENRLYSAVSRFRHRGLFFSLIEPMRASEAGEAHGFTFTAGQVTQYLTEWRNYLRIQVAGMPLGTLGE